METVDVDEFVRTRVERGLRPIVAQLRRIIKEVAPQSEEVISHGIPAFKARRILAVMNPTKTAITFAFAQGAAFKDRYGLLQGVGKKSRHVKIRNLQDINEMALRDYIRQAVALDAEAD